MHPYPKFEENTLHTLKRVEEVFTTRGTQYGDTMRNCQWLTMKAIARRYGIEIDDLFFRALAIAGLCDVKYQRQEGGYKDDNLLDSMAYNGFLAKEVLDLDELLGGKDLVEKLRMDLNGTPDA